VNCHESKTLATSQLQNKLARNKKLFEVMVVRIVFYVKARRR
jgi:hypothetical protein